jgi:bifunctional DNase/RNase
MYFEEWKVTYINFTKMKKFKFYKNAAASQDIQKVTNIIENKETKPSAGNNMQLRSNRPKNHSILLSIIQTAK